VGGIQQDIIQRKKGRRKGRGLYKFLVQTSRQICTRGFPNTHNVGKKKARRWVALSKKQTTNGLKGDPRKVPQKEKEKRVCNLGYEDDTCKSKGVNKDGRPVKQVNVDCKDGTSRVNTRDVIPYFLKEGMWEEGCIHFFAKKRAKQYCGLKSYQEVWKKMPWLTEEKKKKVPSVQQDKW